MNKKIQLLTLPLLIISLLLGACKKDYFNDTGVKDDKFNGTVLDYLKSKPQYFDSLVKIIDYAGMTEAFQNEEVTFFAPADSCLRRTYLICNTRLNELGRPPLTRYQQIKPSVWREALSRYLFKGARSLTDFPQLDPENMAAYPGQIYNSYDEQIMNIGSIYNAGGGVPYAGYRQLMLSYIPSPSSARDFQTWTPTLAASVNIHPSNGYVHVLQYPFHFLVLIRINFLKLQIQQA
ncbi:hypothetical protein [Niabella ginsengisoli]|uniref:FAS1 domain-containing protein n=1 Tax=Niabella ginsengisoli TaxID=522298 RepID=A0ABS9SG04_9BACT|nr:hypothetical protein [Niabella ginsengisoli]MCH5597293.1 hypothetical protein [Niabella ginsengisoli]